MHFILAGLPANAAAPVLSVMGRQFRADKGRGNIRLRNLTLLSPVERRVQRCSGDCLDAGEGSFKDGRPLACRTERRSASPLFSEGRLFALVG